VDAPEIRQPYGEEAKVLLRNLVKDQRLVIHVYNMDQFGRAVGDVYCNGVFIQVLFALIFCVHVLKNLISLFHALFVDNLL